MAEIYFKFVFLWNVCLLYFYIFFTKSSVLVCVYVFLCMCVCECLYLWVCVSICHDAPVKVTLECELLHSITAESVPVFWIHMDSWSVSYFHISSPWGSTGIIEADTTVSDCTWGLSMWTRVCILAQETIASDI